MKTRTNPQRGSLLIVTLLIAAIIELCLASYIRLAVNASRLSKRAAWENQAMNTTEIGLEEAMTAINLNTFTGWTINGANATATFPARDASNNQTYFTFGEGARGYVNVYIQNYASSNPLVVSKGVIKPPYGDDIIKMVEVSGIIQRSLFTKGLVGRNGVTFSGNNASVDSWNSRYDNNGSARAAAVAYNATYAHDKGSIAAINVSATDSVMNADIWGTASVGSSSASAVVVGPQGVVGPYGTARGTKNLSYISTNFTANLPNITTPTPPSGYTLSAISGNTTLPRAGDSAASDGKYYYTVPSISLSGNGQALGVTSGNVVLILTAGQGTSAISISGQGQMTVASGAHLDIYTSANVSIAGNGIVNSNSTDCAAVQIWGTNTSATPPGQSISVSGNGSLAATVYAPNASISAKGGGNSGAIYGSFVGWTVTLTGNDAFHYDENLGNAANGNMMTPTKWRELVTLSDRATYSSQLTF